MPKKADRREPIQREFIKGYLKDYFNRLNSSNIKFIGILGNDDLEMIEEDYYNMISNFSNVIDLDNKLAIINDICFIGLNKVLDTPFFRKDHVVVEKDQDMPKQFHDNIYVHSCKDIVTVEEWAVMRETEIDHMEDLLEKLPKPIEDKKIIYVLHDPPYGIGLDCCRDGAKPGSKAIAEFLKKSNAYMSLHGHIHESPEISGVWHNKLGNTLCIQPGQTEFGIPKLKYVIINTDQNIFERYEVSLNNDIGGN